MAYLETLGESPTYSSQAAGLFQQYCASCHKINGQGGSLGPDLTSVGTRHNLNFFAPFISDPGTVITGASMPGFHNTLSQDQINDLAAYLSSLRGASATPAPSTTSSPLPTTTNSGGPTNPAQLYNTYCQGCHGVNQQGGIGPALTPSALSSTTSSELISIITKGEDNMPGFSNQLNSTQINALADYLKAARGSATPATSTSTSGSISGAQVYGTYCGGCHGVSRQGGIGPALTASALSSRTSAQLSTIITSGKGNMPGFSSQLSAAQISAVTDYIKGP